MTENLQPNREVVAVFDSAENLEDAVDDLLSHGFDRAEVSLLATEGAIDERLGHVYRRAEDARDEERTVYVSEDEPGQARKILTGSLAAAGAMAGGALVVATGGALAPAFLAAALGGGAAGLAGDALSGAFKRERTHELKQRLEEGGIVLFVNAADRRKEKAAVEALCRHSPHAVTVHEIAARPA